MKRIDPSKQATEGAAHHIAAIETDHLRVFPNIVAHCCITRYEDGSSRRPGWVTFKTMGAAWLVTVKDPDSCCQLTASAQALDDALALADLLLGTESAPWEPDPFLKKQGAKKS